MRHLYQDIPRKCQLLLTLFFFQIFIFFNDENNKYVLYNVKINKVLLNCTEQPALNLLNKWKLTSNFSNYVPEWSIAMQFLPPIFSKMTRDQVFVSSAHLTKYLSLYMAPVCLNCLRMISCNGINESLIMIDSFMEVLSCISLITEVTISCPLIRYYKCAFKK